MTLNFQQIQQQVKEWGQNAAQRAALTSNLRQQALAVLRANAQNLPALRLRVEQVVKQVEPGLRCALPVTEPLDASFPAPALPPQVMMIAADGSQITPDRHSEVSYGLINIGAISLQHGSAEPPQAFIESRLLLDEGLPELSEAGLALQRDLAERSRLAEIAALYSPPTVTFCDGPMELWGGAAQNTGEASEFQRRLEEYRQVLRQLYRLGAATAGYVDKPAARMVVRLLEIAATPEAELPEIQQRHPFQPVKDSDLFRELLGPGERSAVFGVQSLFAHQYPQELALHFFYLNVRLHGKPWIARVEIPAWVAEDATLLNLLHAALIEQCRLMGERPYPYLLHRAHETAVVTLPEKEQVTQMLAQELRRQGGEIEGSSHKQDAKDLSGRTAYKKGGRAVR